MSSGRGLVAHIRGTGGLLPCRTEADRARALAGIRSAIPYPTDLLCPSPHAMRSLTMQKYEQWRASRARDEYVLSAVRYQVYTIAFNSAGGDVVGMRNPWLLDLYRARDEYARAGEALQQAAAHAI